MWLRLILWVCVILCFVLHSGCQYRKTSDITIPRVLSINKVLVIGFLAAVKEEGKTCTFRNPFSSSMVFCEFVQPDVVWQMSSILFKKVAAEKNYELVSRGPALGEYSMIISSDKGIGMSPVEMAQEVGKRLGADAVLIGYLYRWKERDGSDYGAKNPASVSFDLQLVRSANGAIIWKSKFDKTQKALSENLFDISTFKESGGKWMTVEKLAGVGLNKMVAEMPFGKGRE